MCVFACFFLHVLYVLYLPFFSFSHSFLLGQQTGANLAVTKFCILNKVLLLLLLLQFISIDNENSFLLPSATL